MTSLRRHLLQHRAGAALMLLAALLMRMLVPAGFMPVVERGAISIIVCAGTGGQQAGMHMPGMGGGGAHHQQEQQSEAGAPCPFSGLTAAALPGPDPLLIAIAVAFVMLLAMRTPDQQPSRPAARLRPPLRAPPLHL